MPAMAETSLHIIAPALLKQSWSEAEVMGGASWLWMHSAFHRDIPLSALASMLLPALKTQQFILAIEAGRPVFYLSWATFDTAAESRYLARHPVFMPEADWRCGDRMWILDWVAPFGHTHRLKRLLERELFANRWMRFLYHRGDTRGMKIKTFHGRSVSCAFAHQWFASHPACRPNAFPETYPLSGRRSLP